MFDIVVIGSGTQDVFMTGVSGKLPVGQKLEIEKMVLASGGGGTNAAVTFARQGFKTAWIGVLGKDVSGDAIIAELKKEGVDTSMHQRHSDDLTAFSAILVDPSGERTILSYKGEGQHFSAAKLDVKKLNAKWLYLDSMGGHYDVFEEVVRYAAAHDIKIACNPGGKELAHGLEKLKPLLANIDIFFANKEEMAELFGAEDPKKYVKGIVSTSDGPRGVVVNDGTATYTAGVPDSPIVERTGAGDAFGSGFTAEYIRSQSIEKAIQFGTANASSVVTQFGAKAGILKKGDTGPWPLVSVEITSAS